MLWTKLRQLISIDPRSLALLRIGLGLLLLVDGAVRFSEVDAMYADSGLMSIAASREALGADWCWSVHRWNGSSEYQMILIGVAALAAVAFTLGWQTWWATLICWGLLSSIHVRCPLTPNGGDQILRLMLFWSLFAPLGRKWSLDAWLARRSPDFTPVASAGTAALLLQLTLVYFFTGLFKSNGDWFSGRALQLAFALDGFLRPLGQYLHNFPAFLKLLTWATLALELAMPIFVWSPWQTSRLRLLAAAMFVGMHLFIQITFTVGLFSAVSIVAWAVFLPREFWESRPLTWLAAKLSRSRVATPQTPVAAPRWRMPPLAGQIWQGVCGLMILFSISANIGSVLGVDDNQIPVAVQRLGQITNTFQRWDMFARVNRNNGWYKAKARLRDGSLVDVLRDGAPYDESRPKLASTNFPNQHWRYLFQSLSRTDRGAYRQAVGEYLTRSWNARHEESRQIVNLELLYFHVNVELNPEGGAFICQEWSQVPEEDTGLFDEVSNATRTGLDFIP